MVLSKTSFSRIIGTRILKSHMSFSLWYTPHIKKTSVKTTLRKAKGSRGTLFPTCGCFCEWFNIVAKLY